MFFYTNVFFICTITQFSVSRCPCPTKQLTTHYPIGFKLHHVSHLTPSFQVKQSIYWLYTDDLQLEKQGENLKNKKSILKINYDILLLIQLRVYPFCFVVSCRTRRSKLSSNSLFVALAHLASLKSCNCHVLQILTSHHFHAF